MRTSQFKFRGNIVTLGFLYNFRFVHDSRFNLIDNITLKTLYSLWLYSQGNTHLKSMQ